MWLNLDPESLEDCVFHMSKISSCLFCVYDLMNIRLFQYFFLFKSAELRVASMEIDSFSTCSVI